MPDSDAFPSPDRLLDDVERAARAVAGQLDDALVRTQRLAAVGTIASVIAHEFNNLLTPLVGYAQTALAQIDRGAPDDALTRKALARTVAHAAQAGKICTAMLALARGEGDDGPIGVQQLVDDALSVLARDPQKDGIALRVQVRPGLRVRGDSVQLGQVLLNLLINARQAMLESGDGERVRRGKGSLTIRGDRAGAEAVAIAVTDSGPGIAPEHVGRVFEPFFTTKTTQAAGRSRGTGLGLAVCRQIVDRHGGAIRVDSVVGRGTTFTLQLPAA